MGSTWRRAWACLGVLGFLGLSVLPPEHVHFAAAHEDHEPAEVVHRHFEPHHATSPQPHVESPDDATYLANLFVVSAPHALGAPSAFVVVAAAPEPESQSFTRWHASGRDLRVHDPPWARSNALRGPPSQLA